ncbi:MAG: nitroreductase/quinone reductase family protein [Chloroflexota bacterium]|nr:nitroreductase/quinone reductase family protein [Chloroflexota bacterium]
MNEQVRQALARDRTIDITTIGRASGQPRRIEMAFSNLDGEIYITGTPGKRDWYANLIANPAFTFHVKQSAAADLAARATPITDPDTRRTILTRILDKLGRSGDRDAWIADSPLVKVAFPDD